MTRIGSGATDGESLVVVFERWATTRGVENSSVKQYRTILARTVAPFFGTADIADVTPGQVERWVERMVHGRAYKPSTVRFRFNILLSVFNWAMEQGLAVITAAPERYRGMLWLMAGCGLRTASRRGG